MDAKVAADKSMGHNGSILMLWNLVRRYLCWIRSVGNGKLFFCARRSITQSKISKNINITIIFIMHKAIPRLKKIQQASVATPRFKHSIQQRTMSQLQYSNDSGRGQHLSDISHYSQAVRIPSNTTLIKLSGQGGWDQETWEYEPPTSPEALARQVDKAFANVDVNLRTAGSKKGWGDVYLARVYMVGIKEEGLSKGVVDALKKWCPNHRPLFTAIGVEALVSERMRVEVEVEATCDEVAGY